MSTMKRLVKLEGFGNVQMAEVDIPVPKPDEVLVRVKRSLISRGSELFRRYVLEDAVSPDIMGYCDAGEVVEVGADVAGFEPGQRVKATKPHAQYVVASPHADEPRAYHLPDGMGYETATFLFLSMSALAWMRATPVEPGDTVVVLGQGIVGNLCAQAVRERRPGRVVAVDATDLRCEVSSRCGSDEVLNARDTDTVEAVLELTNGLGADVVVDCVGGTAGVRSFEQAQRMVKRGGVVHLIALYQAGDGVAGSGLVSLDTRAMSGRRLLVANWTGTYPQLAEDAARMLVDGRIQVGPLITHRLPWRETPEAFHMLYRNPDAALGVILEWDR